MFKLGLKNIRRNPVMSVLVFVQIAIIFIIAISMTSVVVSRFRYYTPIKELLNENSCYYYIGYGLNPVTGAVYMDTETMKTILDSEEDVYATYNVWISYISKNGQLIDGKNVGYDDKFIEIYTPDMDEGEWFDTSLDYGEYIPVVVSKGEYNVGDIIETVGTDGVESFEEKSALVIGVLKEGAAVFELTAPSAGESFNCSNMYANYYTEIEEKTLFIMPVKYFNESQTCTQLNGGLIVTYPDNTDEAVIAANDDLIKTNITLAAYRGDVIKENSLEYIFEQLNTLLPILICVLILTTISTLSVSALTTKRQLKNYAIYFICGLKWKQCAAINFISHGIISVTSLIFCVACLPLLKGMAIFADSVIEFTHWEMLVCMVLVLFFSLLSVLLPLGIISKNTPNKILKDN